MAVNSSYSHNESQPNQNLSCWEKSLETGSTLAIPTFLAPLQATIYVLYLALGLPLNCFVLALIARFRVLRRRDFLLAAHIVAADLLVIFSLPASVASLLVSPSNIFGPSGCSAVGFVVLLFNGVRYTMMFVMCADRFCSVFFPFRYHLTESAAAFVVPPFAVWALWLALAAAPLGMDCYGYEPTTGFCIMQSHCSRACEVYRGVTLSLMTVLGGLVPIVLCAAMFCKARKLASGDGANVAATPSRTGRANVTFFLLFVALVGCSLPTFLVLCLTPLATTSPQFFWSYFGLSLSLFEAILLADPLALMRNSDVRECIRKLTPSACCAGARSKWAVDGDLRRAESRSVASLSAPPTLAVAV